MTCGQLQDTSLCHPSSTTQDITEVFPSGFGKQIWLHHSVSLEQWLLPVDPHPQKILT